MNYEIIDLRSSFSDDKSCGGVVFAEGERDIPFEIKRVYCVLGAQAETQRGYHAHKKNYQLLFCPYGAIEIIVDDGIDRETVVLDSPTKGLILYPCLWREMIWKKDDSVLCVAASEFYDAKEYIRDYEEFKKFINAKKDTV